MAVQIHRLTGDGPSGTDITDINTRANAEDAHSTAGTDNPILIPSEGSNYSYWVNTRLYYDGQGTGTVNNIEWFSDGANGFGTGVTCVGNTATAYEQAVGTPGVTGTVLNTTNYEDLTGAPVDVFGHVTADAKSVTGSVTDPDDEYFANLFVYQMVIASNASAGPTNQETFTWRYDTTIAE
jgi:hypothetical protein